MVRKSDRRKVQVNFGGEHASSAAAEMVKASITHVNLLRFFFHPTETRLISARITPMKKSQRVHFTPFHRLITPKVSHVEWLRHSIISTKIYSREKKNIFSANFQTTTTSYFHWHNLFRSF